MEADRENLKVIPRYGTCGSTTCLLIEALGVVEVGETIKAGALKEACGKGVRPGQDGYGALQSAKRYHLGRGQVFKWQTGQGCVKHLTSKEALIEVDSQRRHIHKSSKESLKTIGSVSVSELNGQAEEVGAKMAMLGTLVLFSSQRTQKMLEKEHITEPLDNTKMLELFK